MNVESNLSCFAYGVLKQMLSSKRIYAKRILPEFKRIAQPDVIDAVLVSESVLMARIIMKEVPLFGDHNGEVFFEPWTDCHWEQGLGPQGFKVMSQIAVAATLAFFTSMYALRSKEGALQFVPEMNGSDFVKSNSFESDAPAVLITAFDAIQQIHNRNDFDGCEDARREKINESFSDFCETLAVYLAQTNESIPFVKLAIDKIVVHNF